MTKPKNKPKVPPSLSQQIRESVLLRPQGRPALPPDEQTKPRSVRLTDARWEKLKLLGSEWLNKAIDKAKEPRDQQKENE